MRYRALLAMALVGILVAIALIVSGVVTSHAVLLALGCAAVVSAVGLLLLMTVRYARVAAAKATSTEALVLKALGHADQIPKGIPEEVRKDIEDLRADLKNEVGRATGRLMNGMKTTLRHDVIRDTAALLTLHDLVDVEGEHVPLTSWSALPATVLLLVQYVRDLPENAVVVEFGSGASTVWMALEAKRRGCGTRIISLEHDADFAAVTQRALGHNGVAELVEIRVAPLAPLATRHGAQLWYSPQTWQDLHDVDLVFVDGPPGGTGPHARYPAVEAMAGRLGSGALVVLDDTDRDDERAALAAWLELESPTGRAELFEERERTSVIRVP